MSGAKTEYGNVKMTPEGEAFVRADDYGFDKMIETLNKEPPNVVTECAGKDCDCHESQR